MSPATLRLFLMTSATTLLVSGAAAQTVPPVATAPQPPPPATRMFEGAVTIGGFGADASGSQARLGEFDDIRDRVLARTGLQLWGEHKNFRFDLTALHGGDNSDQRYAADVQVSRMIKAHVRYQRMPRRLDHDPLSYVDAASGIGGTFVVGHTDNDPFATYGFDYGDLVSRLEVAIPKAPALKFYVSHRQETRSGMRQSLTSSHCATCHVVSYSRGMDQRTRDLAAGVRLATSRFSIDYRIEGREFDERDGGLTHSYNRAVHPATLADVFLNRVQYDQRSGPLPFDTIPGLEKTSHVVTGRVQLPRDASVSGKFTSSESRNTGSGLETRYVGASGRFIVPLGQRLTLRGSARRYDIESDSVFVDVVELVSPAGPTAGKTYAQAYPTFGNPDYVHESSRSRSPTEFGLDLAWKPLRRTTLRVGYEHEQVPRDHFAVERTTTNTLVLNARGVIRKGLQWRARFDHDWTSDPFLNEHAAIPEVLQPFMSPGNVPFTGLQYYTMYDSRQANLTSFPSRAGRFDSNLSWTPSPRASFSAHYRWRGASNDDLNFSTWERSSHAPGAEVWIAPGDRWSLMAGYNHGRERLETMFTTLAFNG